MRLFYLIIVAAVILPGITFAETEEADGASAPSEVMASLAALTVADVLAAVKAPARETAAGKVIAIVTGDTAIVERNNSAVKMRLYGIDCPAPGQPYHQEASQFAMQHILNEVVDVTVLTVDSQQNPVVLLFNEAGVSLSHLLAVHGMAWWDRQNAPNDALLRRLNAEAITNERGLYADAAALAPWDYRNTRGMAQFTYTLDEEEKTPPPAPQARREEENTPISISARGTMTQDRPRAAAPPAARPALPANIGKDVDVGSLMMRHQPRIAKDDSGRPLGLTATDIGAIPYAAQFGFRNGDIVSRVNGIAIESEAQIMSLIPQFQNVKQFNVDVLRNGQTVTIPITVP